MAYKLLDGVSTTGVSSSVKVTNPEKHTIQVTWHDAGADAAYDNLTAITVSLEGSLDDTSFFDLATQVATASHITANGFMIHVVNKSVAYIRANLVSVADDGALLAPLVTVLYHDYDAALRN